MGEMQTTDDASVSRVTELKAELAAARKIEKAKKKKKGARAAAKDGPAKEDTRPHDVKGRIVCPVRTDIPDGMVVDDGPDRYCCGQCADEYTVHPGLKCWRFAGSEKCTDCARKNIDCRSVSTNMILFNPWLTNIAIRCHIELSHIYARYRKLRQSSPDYLRMQTKIAVIRLKTI